MSLKILHVTPSYIPAWRYGGPIYSVHGLCRGLAELGHEVHVITTNADGPQDSAVPLATPVPMEGLRVWYFPVERLRRIYWSPPMARHLAKHVSNFDLVHVHALYLWPTVAGARASRLARVPYVVSPRGMLVKELVRRKSSWAKLTWLALFKGPVLERATALHVTSSHEAVEAQRFRYDLPPIFVVPNGVESRPEEVTERVSEEIAGTVRKSPLIVFLGRVNWEKGLDRLVRALTFTRDAHLAIAGNDEENCQPKLERLAAELGVRERITFTGPVRGAAKVVLLRHARLLVLPSYHENFGNVVLEAMAASCPVVVTPEVGASEIVMETGAGWVCEGTPARLGELIDRVLADPAALEQAGLKGGAAAADKYSWRAIAKRMEQNYLERVLGWPPESA